MKLLLLDVQVLLGGFALGERVTVSTGQPFDDKKTNCPKWVNGNPHPAAIPPERGAPVSPSPILTDATENERVATNRWLARRRGLAMALRNIVIVKFDKRDRDKRLFVMC